MYALVVCLMHSAGASKYQGTFEHSECSPVRSSLAHSSESAMCTWHGHLSAPKPWTEPAKFWG